VQATLSLAAMADFLHVRGYWHQALALLQTALAAALRRALALHRDLGDRAGQSFILNCQGYLDAAGRRLPGDERLPPAGTGPIPRA
jgi:hypothetical protein